MKRRLDFLLQPGQAGGRGKIIQVAVIVLFLALVIAAAVYFDLSTVKGFILQHRQQAVLISFGVVFLSGLALVPTIPFTLLTAMLIGPLQAILITTAGETLTALAHYQIGKQMGSVVNFEQRKARLPFKLGRLPVGSPLFLLLGRAIPGMPKGLSFLCGAYSVPHIPYLWTTVVTNLMGAALVAFSGSLLAGI